MRKKIISIILLVAMVLTMAAGCGKKEDKKERKSEYKEEKEASIKKYNKNIEERKAHLERFIDRFRYKATKAKAVQSRIKICRHSRRMQRFEEPFHAK